MLTLRVIEALEARTGDDAVAEQGWWRVANVLSALSLLADTHVKQPERKRTRSVIGGSD